MPIEYNTAAAVANILEGTAAAASQASDNNYNFDMDTLRYISLYTSDAAPEPTDITIKKVYVTGVMPSGANSYVEGVLPIPNTATIISIKGCAEWRSDGRWLRIPLNFLDYITGPTILGSACYDIVTKSLRVFPVAGACTNERFYMCIEYVEDDLT